MISLRILGVQIISLLCLFASMAGIFLLPYYLVHRRPGTFGSPRYQTALSLANCLSGGVFIATFFVGLMPEVRDLFCEILQNNSVKYPVTELVIFLGFLLALGIEQFVLDYQERKPSRYTSIPSGLADNSSKNNSVSSSVDDSDNNVEKALVVDYDSDNSVKSSPMAISEPGTKFLGDSIQDVSKRHGHSHGCGHSHSDVRQYLKGEAGIRLGLLMVSMGVHSLFEGLALGLQTSVPVLINLVIGVAIHELLVAFAMGVNVSRLKLPRSTVLKLAVIFSASIPVGQAIGLLIGQYKSLSALSISAILQGLAAGTFIHVTFLEVIPSEFQEPGHRILKVFFLGLGFVILLVCTVIMNHFMEKSH